MEFEWANNKAESNIRNHGVSFETAAHIFAGPTVEAIDDREDYGEARWHAIGQVNDQILVVIYTEREDVIRIISAWKATAYDRKRYYEEIGKKSD